MWCLWRYQDIRLKKMIKKLLFLLLIGFGISKPFVVLAQDTDALSINISPPVSYLYVKPGAGISAPIYLENQGRYTLSIKPQLVDFRPHQQTGQVILQQTSSFEHVSIAGDDNLWGKEFLIKPGENYTLPLTIAIPADFPQGEYYLSVLFDVEQMLFSEYERSTNTILSGIIASHLVLAVNLDEADRSQIVIKDFKLPKVVDSLMGINFQIWAKNTGFNAGPIEGKLVVSHWPSPKEQVYEFYPDMVLANSQRQVRGMSDEDLASLKTLSEQEDLIVANDQDFFQLQSSLLQKSLISDFSYKKPFLIGAYDFRLQLGEEERLERVVALPFSILIIVVILTLLYRFLVYLIKDTSIKRK